MKISQSTFFSGPVAKILSIHVLLVLLLLPATSCAKVGDPMPPLPSDVVLVGDLQLLQLGNETCLTFANPVRELSEIEIYRLCEGAAEQINETDPVAVLPGSELKKFSFLDRSFVAAPAGDLSSPCVFAVRTKNMKGKRSGFSNLAEWKPVELPLPPVELITDTSETEVRIEWRARDTRPGQRPAQAEFLVNLMEVTRDSFYSISDFSFGAPLSFEVRTMDRDGGTILLSEPLELESFVPEDVFPPRSPSGLIAVRLEDRVQMTWDDNSETDLAGYHVYRTAPGGEPQRVSQLVTINRFVYPSSSSGTEGSYTVTAVDKWGNESTPAGVVE